MKRTVKWYLIQRFLIALFFVYWGGVLIDLFYRMALNPAVLIFLESQQIEITGNSDVFAWLLQVLFYVLAGFLRRAFGTGYRVRLTQPWGAACALRLLLPSTAVCGACCFGF